MDDSDPRVMTTPSRIDLPIFDEYNREEMEALEVHVEANPQDEFYEPQFAWDHPSFQDVTAWIQHQPDDEFLGINHADCPDLLVGTTFPNKAAAKYAVQKWCILHRVEYKVSDSDTKRWVLECRRDPFNCPWRLRVAKLKNKSYWELRIHQGPHVCHNATISRTNYHLTKKFIAREYWDQMNEKLRLSAGEIQARVAHQFGYDISYLKAWQAKQQALKYLFGTWDESFTKLPQLMDTLVENNPQTVVVWDKFEREDGYVQVNRVFWAFGETINAYTHCRPVLCVDGTHMYGKYKATILVAIALDANNHILPIAFAMVESENNSSWRWFMHQIRRKVTQRDGLCVISDRHAGILSAMNGPEWAPPRASHRYCLRHLKSNFNTKVKDLTLKAKLGFAAQRKKMEKFRDVMSELNELLNDKLHAKQWLEGLAVEKWALALDDGGMRWGSMTTNASEGFNFVLKFGRDLPISAFVMYTYRQIAAYFVERAGAYDRYGAIFPPKIEERLEQIRAKGQFHRVKLYNPDRGIYEVVTSGKHHKYTCCLTTRTCSCGKWTLFHYPCSHVMAVCKYERLEYSDFVPYEYTMDAYNRTWSNYFAPLPDERYWTPYEGPPHVPNPLFNRNKVGRNPSTRHHNEMDHLMGLNRRGECSTSQQPNPDTSQHGSQSTSQSASQSTSQQASQAPRIQKCTICKTVGHNKRACPTRWV